MSELKNNRIPEPNYSAMHNWEFYASNLLTEYTQSVEEGLNIEAYRDVFQSVSRLPKGEIQKKLGDILYEVVMNAPQKEDYPYKEPSDLESIRALRQPYVSDASVNTSDLEDKIHGAWLGRVCGCMLGKSVEGIRTDELIPFLKETGNFPLHRYIRRSDLTEEICGKYQYPLAKRIFADEITMMPSDDDTNYTVMAQMILNRYGRAFTAEDVARTWLEMQPKNAYCTAERVAFCNFVQGFVPPESAVYKNPFREWIGAQIRGDYFGYINPGDPETAAEMAFRDASVSHVKNGIYGEMFIAAMIAAAAAETDIEVILHSGLAQIPHTSRLHESVTRVITAYKSGTSCEDIFAEIHAKYDEHTAHGWCHTISNAMIVAASLLYGGGDYSKSICMAVEAGFDTDCNGATVGSILGMTLGTAGIPSCWSAPIHDTLKTTIYGVGTVKISECARTTLYHLK